MCMGGHGSHGSHAGNGESAIGILKRRFAAGEITREEYEEMKRVIRAGEGEGHEPHAAH